ncbi:hypothetical protein TYRP_006219 [Tyrophagus putrescentiae]|nr:hypothetical protein TYRP_006219 [Tyrophagus putrescentiae]
MSLAQYLVKREAHSLAVPVKFENSSSLLSSKAAFEKISQLHLLPTAIAVNRSFLLDRSRALRRALWTAKSRDKDSVPAQLCVLIESLFLVVFSSSSRLLLLHH